jgi:hypothetical protein
MRTRTPHFIVTTLAALVFVGAFFGAPTAAWAASPQILGSYTAWDAFKLTRDGQTLCYVVAQPGDMAPKGVNRGDVFFMITRWVELKRMAEPSVITGYTYRQGSSVTVAIGSDSFDMFTQGDGAWLRNSGDETKLINAMRRGSKLIIKGTSSRGTLTTDEYSLSGISKALDKIKQVCP